MSLHAWVTPNGNNGTKIDIIIQKNLKEIDNYIKYINSIKNRYMELLKHLQSTKISRA